MKKILLSFILLTLVVMTVNPALAETKYEKSAAEKVKIAKNIVWPNHEPLSFYLRRGKMAENWPEIYARQHTPENIDLMAKAGVKYGRLHFYKGLGIAAEMPEIQNSMRMAGLMRERGMKVSLYVAGTMFTEPFYKEVPEAKNWEQRDQDNKWIPYSGTQTFRHFACQNESDYRDYMKKVLKIGVDSVKTNQFFFDNVFVKPEPKSCRCPRCMTAFHQYLDEKYPTPEQAFRRFGVDDTSILIPTEWDVFNQPFSLAVIDDPVLQEWIRFRCETLANQCNDFYDYIKSLDSNISVGFNLKGLYGENRYWRAGVYHPLFQGKCDFFPFDTGGMDARLDEKTGALVAEIRSYKCARTLDMTCSTGGNDLEYAVYMTYNYQKKVPGYGYIGGPEHNGAYRQFTPLTEFFREYNDRYFRDTRNVADVAVLRSWPSMAYSIWQTLVPTILAEQVLIQHKVPFDIIFDEQIASVGKYKAVILPGQESLSMEMIEKLLAYAKAGGTLIFTDNTADYNDWRERRAENPLRKLVEYSGRGNDTVVKTLGKGKLVYIPKIVPDVPGSKADGGDIFAEDMFAVVEDAASGARRPFASELWLLPANDQQIVAAVRDNIDGGVSLESDAPLTVVAELLTRDESRETIAHFINFEQNRLQPFSASVAKQYQGKVKKVSYFSKDSEGSVSLDFTDEGNKVSFTVPEMGLYGMVVVSQ